MLVELVGGLVAQSLALLADAGHMFTDAAALALALAAVAISRRPADARRSYGYHRAQVLAAFVNGLSLLLISAWICYEAVLRLLHPAAVQAVTMLVIAALGLAVNGIVFWVLHGGADENLNVRGALAHVLGDLLGSVAAIVAGVVIYYTQWTPVDPLLSMLVALLIVRTGWRVTRESAHILLEGTPESLETERVESVLAAVPGLDSVHHVHAWALTPQRRMLTLHAVLAPDVDGDHTTARIVALLREQLRVDHVTVQIERGNCVGGPCLQARH